MKHLSKTVALSLFFISSTILPMRSGLPKAACAIVKTLHMRTIHTHYSFLNSMAYECVNGLEKKGLDLIQNGKFTEGIAMLRTSALYEEDDLIKRNPRKDEAIQHILQGNPGLAKTALEQGQSNKK